MDDEPDMSETVSPNRTYRRDIDGLRSLAILSVVLYHAGVGWLSGGFTGVDIFFVLSGYLIGGHIYTDLQRGRFSFAVFYQRRAKRILPPLYLVLASLLAVGMLLLSPYELRDVAKSAFATVASASNILLWKGTGYFTPQADRNPLLMTWSLAVEEQFYVVVPVLMVLLARLRRRLILPVISVAALASFGLSCVQIHSSPMAAFYLLPGRAWELAAGVALAILELQVSDLPLHKPGVWADVSGFVGMGFVVGAFCLITAATPFPGPAALSSVLGCVMLLAASGSWLNRKVLSLAPLVFIGRVSYSWYLWHWPLLALLRAVYGAELPMWLSLCAVWVAFVLAAISYQWIEKPFRSAKTAVRPVLLRYAAVSFVFLGMAFLLWRSDGWMGRYPALTMLDQTELAVQQDACLAGVGEARPRLIETCTHATSRVPQIALWGDSHAAALSPALRDIVARNGYELQVYAKATCPPLLGAGRATENQPQMARECIADNALVMQHLLADQRVQTVALEAFWEAALVGQSQLMAFAGSRRASEQVLADSLQETVQRLQAAGKHVVFFDDVPTFAVDPMWRMRTSRIPLRMKMQRWLLELSGQTRLPDSGSDDADDQTVALLQARANIKKDANMIPGLETWCLRKQLCNPKGVCLYREGGTPLYIDTNHLTYDGGRIALQGWTLAVAK